MAKHLVVIGRAEFIDFPDFLISNVPAKIDTGAYSSAVHCQNIELINKNGKDVLTFELLGGHPSVNESFKVETSDFSTSRVQNSFGVSEERFAVNLRIKLGYKTFISRFTLADRSKKPFPILLGRTTLNGRFLVDTNHTNIERRKLLEKTQESLMADKGESDR